MPPHPYFYEGRAAMAELLERAFGDEQLGDWKLVRTRANRMPTVRRVRAARDALTIGTARSLVRGPIASTR